MPETALIFLFFVVCLFRTQKASFPRSIFPLCLVCSTVFSMIFSYPIPRQRASHQLLLKSENYEKSVECEGKAVSFSLWDTAGQEGSGAFHSENCFFFFRCLWFLSTSVSFLRLSAYSHAQLQECRCVFGLLCH